ncbi:unnamed protein product [Adineta ricciae]|uniref:Tyrosine-protein kinase ephrin type A/B receptor-like domain-containing protein n=1 Tax=Adineta ricciae TaxID=249248 RepID=A0A815HW55_ADIRI|nr:unnamed protein product [Adineta ricciae]CAF1360409.1 unnamed protein product [Adineta ricciae]
MEVAFLLLLLIFEWKTLAIKYESADDSHDLKVALSDEFIVGVSNLRKIYNFYSVSNITQNSSCTTNNPHSELNIYGLSVLKMKQNHVVSFVQLAENKTSKSTVFSRITMNLTTCDSDPGSQPVFQHLTVWTKGRQEHMFLKVDRRENFAYIFADSFIFSYDLLLNQINQIDRTNSIMFDSSYESFTPYAFDIKHDWAVVAGSHSVQNQSRSKQCLYILGLQPLRVINVSTIGANDLQGPDKATYNQDYDISLSINPSGTAIAIGEAQLNKVTIAYMNGDDTFPFVSKFHEISEPENWTGFGRSVIWLNDDETLAILVLKSRNHNSAKSEIQVYENISHNRTRGSIIPSFVIPNNQQTLNNILRSKSSRKHSFHRIRARSNSLLILLKNADVVFIPSADAGFCSMELSSVNFRNLYILQPRPCVSGSYKNASGPGPCTICPSGTKNPGDYPAIVCQPCNSSAFCPLGATNDVDLTNFRSYIQTFSYPDSPIIDDYDDLLLLNFFPTNMKASCMVLTPLFWTAVATILCLIMWFTMFLIKRRRPTVINSYRQRAKIVLKHNDLIGEGERWIGGLASIIIFTIIIHCAIFSFFYFQSYPIETAEAVDKVCDNTQRNSKFDNALQLPLPGSDGTYWQIFDMLNKQPFTMTLHLINTRAQCGDITVERSRHTGTPLSIGETICTSSTINDSISFSFALPTHTSTVRASINGPYFIGALRLCLYGEPDAEMEESALHQLRELDICTLFHANNQTIGLSTGFTVRLIKVINVTKPLRRSDRTYYDGIWAPFITYTDVLSDEAYFAEKGEYLRYASEQTTINIEFREEIYFVQNNQSPIIRRGALFFRTILFSFSLIEIFAMAFLLYKLWFHPIRRRILTSRDDPVDDELQMNQAQNDSHVSSLSKHQMLPRKRGNINGRCWNRQKSHRTKDNREHSTKLGTIEYLDEPLTSPSLLTTSSNQIEH